MTNIILICAGGFSTSLLMNKMKEAAKAEGKEVNIEAMAEENFEKSGKKPNVLLLAPQVAYLEEKYKTSKYEGIKVHVINMIDYGMMNGEKVLKEALEL
ncbi:PTS sugar transporter subunit IIB [Lactobacillus mulieris]|uniref:PTS sugar transporter subunit IIB n=1 Tax=Lactobacillus mulieris TaxID=2508708 RepID=UPI001432943A|nr:PTS sugar transporter subunit IIB [Lactobacillus mulieris]MCF1783647.1 PTS sugar transporter subunit IIB [Lactobacillus mulieris]MCW8104265.1 PTS sugar transporter subunit IIB [Lactobacillus mulieris]MDK6803125.1 PTS sugar transporter subunit IIB [Lactobacillus mulieris]MDK8382241.1 PTS sugar transporter subunit IIB [Lactobacillus mulieris]MDT9620383.1 PTS sugar transporter subunit IIB [Lactobacillus mulieris]